MRFLALNAFFCLFCLIACNPSDPSSQSALTEMQEQHRPYFHFTPTEKWMNDPNGMVFFEGEYHLFYQYYPDSTVWGPMHWGHAVSKDLLSWEHLPIALYPDSLGIICSGSAVIDWKNTSGFGENGQAPLVAMYTYHSFEKEKAGSDKFQYQGIAYSNDKGRTWTKFEDNPVIPNPGIRDFRDTKVIWDEQHNQWLMVLAARDQVMFYGSEDLKNWNHLSDFGKEWGAHGGVWECPDIFPMDIEGTDEQAWVMLLSLNPGGPNGGSGTQYFIGDFDGTQFILDPDFAKTLETRSKNEKVYEKAIWLDYGRDNYAGVTWSDAPDGRRIFIGWMSNWDYGQVVPTESWRSAMTVPRELVLQNTSEGLRLKSLPIPELEQLRKSESVLQTNELEASKAITFHQNGTEIQLSIEPPTAGQIIGIELSNSLGETYRIGYDANRDSFFSDRRKAGKIDFSEKFAADIHWAPRQSDSEILDFHFFFDVASVELFADEGSTVITDIFFPNEDFNQAKIFVEGGAVNLKSGTIYKLE